jgi:4-amino-4-deoxy-L-arabinose transferase-like glycosyltransferase
MITVARLADCIERRPRAAFAWLMLLHAVVWSVLPAALYCNLPLDLIEALTYGREWQLGYDKLPPLPWWLVEVVDRTVGLEIAYYGLAQSAVIAAFLAIWALARRIVGSLGALVAVLIVDGLHYFHYTAAKFNHDVIQLPLWALAFWAFHSALRRGRLIDWSLLGISIGAALWAKYFVVVLVAPLALFLLFDRAARPALRTPGPWLALIIAIAVMAPHLAWLVANDFLPFGYASARAVASRGLLDHVWQPLRFTVGQLLFLVPTIAIASPLVRPRPAAPIAQGDPFDRRIVAVMTFGPFATLVALSVATGRALIAMWGYPVWLCLGLWIVVAARAPIDRVRLARISAVWGLVFLSFAAAFAANYTVVPAIDHRYRAVFFPGERLAAEVSSRFRGATGRPLAYVVATMWVGGNIAHYAPEHPRVLIDGKPARAPWIDLGDFKRRGAAIVWTENSDAVPPELSTFASNAKIQEPLRLPMLRGNDTIVVHWAILEPER